MLSSVGKKQGITLEPMSGTASNGSGSAEMERQVVVKLASGTRGSLLAAYRNEVRHEIEKSGGTIYGDARSGGDQDIVDFSYDYSCAGSAGFVKVYSFDRENGEHEVITLCFEYAQ